MSWFPDWALNGSTPSLYSIFYEQVRTEVEEVLVTKIGILPLSVPAIISALQILKVTTPASS